MADEERNKPQKPDDEPAGKVYDSRLIRRLGHYLRPYWWQAAVSALAVSLKSICDVAGPYLIMVAIDRYFPKDSGFSPATNLLANVLGSTNWLTRRLPADPYQGITRLAAI
jgi:ATP-binding cassette subfamily B protein